MSKTSHRLCTAIVGTQLFYHGEPHVLNTVDPEALFEDLSGS